MKTNILTIATAAILAFHALAATADDDGKGGFTVHVTAVAEEEVENDLLVAALSVERSGADSAELVREVAAVMRRALDEGDKVPTVKLRTAAYSTQPAYERQRDGSSRQSGWRVAQTLALESTDVEAATALIGRFQAGGLQLTAMTFTVSDARRESHRAALADAAIDAWTAKARAAVKRLGGGKWRPREVSVQDDGHVPVRPMMMRADTMMAESAPPAVEAGTSRLRVTVSGSAWAARRASGD